MRNNQWILCFACFLVTFSQLFLTLGWRRGRPIPGNQNCRPATALSLTLNPLIIFHQTPLAARPVYHIATYSPYDGGAFQNEVNGRVYRLVTLYTKWHNESLKRCQGKGVWTYSAKLRRRHQMFHRNICIVCIMSMQVNTNPPYSHNLGPPVRL